MYPTLSAAHDRAKQLAGIPITDITRDTYTDELLTLSAGKIVTTTEYRPFYVAAKLLEQDLDIQAISEADKVKFTGQSTVIASLLNQQSSIDLALGTIVPPGFEAVVTVDGVALDIGMMSIFTV